MEKLKNLYEIEESTRKDKDNETTRDPSFKYDGQLKSRYEKKSLQILYKTKKLKT